MSIFRILEERGVDTSKLKKAEMQAILNEHPDFKVFVSFHG